MWKILISSLKRTGLRGYYRAQDQKFYECVVIDLRLKSQFDTLIHNAKNFSLDTTLLQEAWENLIALYSGKLDPKRECDLNQYI